MKQRAQTSDKVHAGSLVILVLFAACAGLLLWSAGTGGLAVLAASPAQDPSQEPASPTPTDTPTMDILPMWTPTFTPTPTGTSEIGPSFTPTPTHTPLGVDGHSLFLPAILSN